MELPYDPAILFVGIYSKELKVETQIFEHHVHCNTIHNNQRVEATKHLLTEEWINKLGYIHTIEYFSAI